MHRKDKFYELIVKYLTSEISEEEQNILNEEFTNNSSFNKNISTLKKFWDKSFQKPKPNSIIEITEAKLGFTTASHANNSRRFLLKIAAAVIMVMALGFSGYHLLKPEQKLELNEYSCGSEEIKQITLSDGTQVWLNSMSFLIVSEPFIGKTREVKLFGEAYFEVAHNTDQPFIVRTPQLKTRVLGTHFNIVAYPTDEIHEISLYEGKVRLNAENKKDDVFLKPGDRAYFTTKTGKIKVISTDLGKPAKWRDGILRFYNEDLFSITKKLQRKFHKKIFIADSVAGKLRFTAEFDVEPLEKILKLLNKAHEFEYKITENGIIIQSTEK